MAPEYSREQLSQFLAHIDVPAEFRLERDPRPDLSLLTALHVHMITAVPYENMALHYSRERRIRLDPQFLFCKIVGDARGRGGYCLENSLFFLYVLRALGFDVYPVGVKIRLRVDGVPQGNFVGHVHIVNIVTLEDDTRWAVDVGFGGDGMTRPMALEEGATIRNMGTQDARLTLGFVPGQTVLTPGRRRWIYQCRNGAEKPWTSFYSFADGVEWLPEDFEVVNHYTSQGDETTRSFQTERVLAIKFLRRPAEGVPGGEEVYGKHMLVNEVVKANYGGRTEVVRVCKSEEERATALREWFGIELMEEERTAIKGHKTEIKGSNY